MFAINTRQTYKTVVSRSFDYDKCSAPERFDLPESKSSILRMGPAFSAVFFLLLVVHLLPTATALPAGFEDENVVKVSEVVDVAFAGNVLLAVAKPGYLYTLDLEDPNAERVTAADLTSLVCSNGERG